MKENDLRRSHFTLHPARTSAQRTMTLLRAMLLVIGLGMLGASMASAPNKAKGIGMEDKWRTNAGSIHFVILDDPPLARYRGGIADLEATSAEVRGDRFLERKEPAAIAYLEFLAQRQDLVMQKIQEVLGRPVKFEERYTHTLNGFSMRVRPAEADVLRGIPGIEYVEQESMGYLLTDAGPRWSGSEDLWTGQASPDGQPVLGAGTIIGIVDTGINIDHPSFAAVDSEGHVFENPLGAGSYLNFCDPGNPNFNPDLVCNAKLLGLWSHNRVGGDPEDENNHGSHTAGTAAGNRLPGVQIGSRFKAEQDLSGVAPFASISAYDACRGNGCPGQATLAAMEQAARDGVHILNYSITVDSSHGRSPWRLAHNEAFLSLREAGIFVAVAAGNDGPRPQTLTSNAPWITTIANSSHDRMIESSLVEMSGGGSNPPADLAGTAFAAGVGPATIIYSKGQTLEDGSRDDGQCLTPFFAGALNGKIVVCERGQIPRVAKGQHVLAGGADGLVLVNTEAEGRSTYADEHFLPAVHLDYESGQKLLNWLSSGNGHTGRITASEIRRDSKVGDILARSSGRGPALISKCCERPEMESTRYREFMDVIKPDISAPGTDVLAAFASKDGVSEPGYGYLSGTSMASPHVAGAAALLVEAWPAWRPAEIQSALMLSARNGSMRKQDRTSPADAFDRGSGHLDVSAAARTGLIMGIQSSDFELANPDQGGQPKDLNLASLADGACVGRCSWQRTLSNPIDEAQSWRASFEGPADLGVKIRPESFHLDANASQTLFIEASPDQDIQEAWLFGRVRLDPISEEPRFNPLSLPLAVHPQRADLPRRIRIVARQAEDELTVDLLRIRTSALSDVRVSNSDLFQPTSFSLILDQAPPPRNPFEIEEGRSVEWMSVSHSARRLVAEISKADTGNFNLWMGIDLNGDRLPSQDELRCTSATGHWAEYCDVLDPTAGEWWIMVQNRSAGDQANCTLLAAVVSDQPGGSLSFQLRETHADPPVFRAEIEASWALPNLSIGDRWYGVAGIGNASNPSCFGTRMVNLIGVDPAATPQSPDPIEATPRAPHPTFPPLNHHLVLPKLEK